MAHLHNGERMGGEEWCCHPEDEKGGREVRRGFFSGMRQALPIVLGYIPVGFAYGVLAQKSGLGLVNTVAMSIIVFAGSAQLIGAGLFGAGTAPLAIVVTTFIVNLRHLLMSAALAPRLRHWKRCQIALFGYELTDETFALHSLRMAAAQPPLAETFGVNITAQFSWIAGSLAGYLAGGQIADVRPIGLDYALPAMFIALLVPQLVSSVFFWMAILAGFLSVALSLGGLSQSHVIVATVVASTVGVGVERWIKRASS
ncbi:MAG: AzlC family ABC transporter permease [Desulfopila sp.]